MAAVKLQEQKQTTTYAVPVKDGRAVVRRPRPIEGDVDIDAIIDAVMKQYPKTRARLAE